MDPVKGDAGNKHQHLKTHSSNSIIENDSDQTQPILRDQNEVEKEASCSSSTISDDSSEDFFQLDAAELDKSIPGNTEIANGSFGLPQHGGNAQELSTPCGAATSTNGFLSLIDDDDDILSGPRSPGTRTSSELGLRQSPSIQMMERYDVPDPNRIPASIFSRTKSTSPMEWSVASNESLFSIHVGNSSFSRDQSILMGRSGEISPYAGSPTESYPPMPASPSSIPAEINARQEELWEPTTAETENAKAIKAMLQANAAAITQKEQHLPEADRLSASLSRHSDGSTTSYHSFAFPILIAEGRSSSARDTAGQRTKADTGDQLEPEKTQQHPVETEATEESSAAVENKWFCFPCCSSCC